MEMGHDDRPHTLLDGSPEPHHGPFLAHGSVLLSYGSFWPYRQVATRKPALHQSGLAGTQGFRLRSGGSAAAVLGDVHSRNICRLSRFLRRAAAGRATG